MTMVAAVISWIATNSLAGVLELAVGRQPAVPEPVSLLVSGIIYGLVFMVIFVVSVRRHPAWVTVSGRGLELAATGRDPVFLPWPAVAVVDRRFRWVFTDLVVAPHDMAGAEVVHRGWTRPRTIVRHGHRCFVVDVGLMRPAPAAVLAEIHRRRAERPVN